MRNISQSPHLVNDPPEKIDWVAVNREYSDEIERRRSSGLSSSHISPQRYKPKLSDGYSSVKVWPGGSRVELKIAHQRMQAKPASGSTRGNVTEFSKRSRRRLLNMLNEVKRHRIPIFVTLTYPGHFTYDYDDCKRHRDNWIKRLRRKFPNAGVIWRVEFKRRKSGASEGFVVPHFHAFVWGVECAEFREWAAVSWNGVVALGDVDHLAAGTSVEKIRTWRGVMFYASKYIAKNDDASAGISGRHWGVSGREFIPWSSHTILQISERGAYKLRRSMVRHAGFSPRGRSGMSMFTENPERWCDVAEAFGAGAIPF